MFKKKSNKKNKFSKLEELEAKIDKLSNEILKNFSGCNCRCNSDSNTIDKSLSEKIVNLEKNIDNIKKLFSDYRMDVMNNIENVIDHIYRDTENFKDNIIFTRINDMININNEKLKNELVSIQNKINYMEFDNEILKKNLNIEQDLREYEEKYNLLYEKIYKIIKEI